MGLRSIAAVLPASFGRSVRANLFPPQLVLRLADADGEAASVKIGSTPPKRARNYHLSVLNERCWFPATEVRGVLLQVEKRGPNDAFRVAWRGEVQIGWRNGERLPPTRTIGWAEYAHFFSVVEGVGLRLNLLTEPPDLPLAWLGASTLLLTLQARASEVDSPPLRTKVDWDGNWHPGETEMGQHLKVAHTG